MRVFGHRPSLTAKVVGSGDRAFVALGRLRFPT